MKNKTVLTVAAVLFLTLQPYQFVGAADQKAETIVTKILNNLAPGQWKGSYRFTNYRTDGTQKTYTLEVLAYDRDTVHIVFTSPAVDVGRQILNRNGEIWSYLPDSRKVVRLADRDSIGNGDFNNADVMKLNWLEDYTMAIVKESESQWVIDMKAKPDAAATYYMMRLWVSRKDNQPIQQYFYDSSGHHLKTLKYREVKQFSDTTRPAHLIMENVITGQRTFLEVITFEKKSNLPESRFRQENLGK